VTRRRPRRPSPYREINRKLDKLIHLFERVQPTDYVQFVISMSKTTNLTIADSTIGNLAIDSQQTIGSIDQKIGALQSGAKTRTVATAFAALTEASRQAPILPRQPTVRLCSTVSRRCWSKPGSRRRSASAA
jgi:hypothetical protein